MQELILIISRCASSRKRNECGEIFYKFHFKGYYSGERIKEIHLYFESRSCVDERFTKGVDYFLWVNNIGIGQQILKVELIKHKLII